ncbi:MAG: discoidin domain-containing protein [Pyrinomonadaceae bacterium]
MTYNSRGLVTNVANEWSSPPPPPRKNYALPANGATGSASSVYSSSFPVASAFNGERAGIGWGSGNGGWNDSTNNSYPDWLQVDFGGEKVIDEIDVFTIQDNDTNPSAPTEPMTFTEDGIIDFDVEYWDGDSWETVPDGSVTGNNKVWRKFTFSPIATSKVRVVVNYSGRPVYRYSRIAELEAWGPDDTAPPVETSTSFSYDDLGNRVSMTDEYGGIEYEYNALSQLTAETREFNVSMPSAPLPNNKFKIQYQYSLGTLKSYTDPFGQQINYGRDEMGRATAITGSSFGGVTTYAQDAERRAWGGLKAVTYTGGTDLALTYNDRMKVASMGLQKADTSYLMNKTYEYYKDGKIKFLDDAVDARFDRLNTYDHRGLISEALSGGEARGETVDEADRQTSLPYRQTYAFNAFGQMTASTNMHWGVTSWNGVSFDQETDYENNRIQKTGWEFDNDGRNTKAITDGSETILTAFDAAGRLIQRSTSNGLTRTYYDGNGKKMTSTSTFEAQKYLIRSSLLGGRVVSEVWPNGKKYRSYVKGLGNQTAVQTAYASESASLNESVLFEYSDVLGMSYRTTDKNATAVAYGDGGEGSPIETDPLGGSVGTSTPYIEIAAPWAPEPEYPELLPFIVGGEGPMTPDFGSLYSTFGSRIADLPGFGTNWGSFTDLYMVLYEERVENARLGFGFVTNEQYAAQAAAQAAQTAEQDAEGGSTAAHEAGHTGSGINGEGSSGAGSGDGTWVDTSTSNSDLNNNVVTINVSGYWNLNRTQTTWEPQRLALYKAYTVLTQKLIFNNFSGSCQKNVFDKLKKHFSDFDQSDFVRYVNNSPSSGLRDGTTSTDPVAGTITGAQAATNPPYAGSTTVADYFRNRTGMQAVTSITSPHLLVFFRPSTISLANEGNNRDNLSLLFHEALHGYGGKLGGTSYFDDELQAAFGLSSGASENISQYIRRNCF